MSQEDARLLSDIRYIREMMELSSEHKVLPDWAAIIGGLMVLGAAALTWRWTGSADAAAVLLLSPLRKLAVAALWVATVAVSVLLYWALAARESRRLGVSLAARPTRLARQAIGPAMAGAAVLTARLVIDGRFGFIPSVWMLCYGIGLYNAGLFSTEEPRLLGLCFLVTGVVSMLVLRGMDLWMAALSFGGYHIAFGAYVLAKKRRA